MYGTRVPFDSSWEQAGCFSHTHIYTKILLESLWADVADEELVELSVPADCSTLSLRMFLLI